MRQILIIMFVFGFSMISGMSLLAQVPSGQPTETPPSALQNEENELASKTLVLLEGMVKNSLDAYNNGDARVFFGDFSAKVASLTTEEDFKILYADMYKKDLGNFTGKELILERNSSIYSSSKTAIVGFSGSFEKAGKVPISSVFSKDDKDWKIISISFHATPEEKK